jgi:hypothetical protein
MTEERPKYDMTNHMIGPDKAPMAITVQSPHMRLIELAVTGGADINQLEKLMDLQDRHEAKEARKSFFEALSLFQSKIPTIKKTGLASFQTKSGRTEYSYAKLDDIARVIRPSLRDSGLSYRYEQNNDKTLITLKCIVTHKDGHSEATEMSGFSDATGSKNPIQQIASTISYLRRYTLTGALGVTVGDEDDDGGYVEPVIEITEAVEVTGNSGLSKEDAFFEDTLPAAKKQIEAGNKTPEQILAFYYRKGINLNEQQTKRVIDLGETA